jgi:hypothetical protein
MGQQRGLIGMCPRLSIVVAIATVALLGGGAQGCSREADHKQERQRALLRPSDYRQKLEEQARKKQLWDAKGDLIDSGEQIAGLNLPKGVSLIEQIDSRWYLTSTRLPYAALDSYFGKQLFTGQVERDANSVSYVGANIKRDPKALKVNVRISKQMGGDGSCELVIQQGRIPPPIEQSRAMMANPPKYVE